MRYSSSLAAVLLLFLAGCNQTPTPPDTREADAKAIRDGEAAWVKDFASKDADKVASHYAEDATLDFPDMARLNGKGAILTFAKQMLADPNLKIDFAASTVEVSKDNLAYSKGTYSLTQTAPKGKRVVAEKGKYVTVYKKQADGSWKAVADILNADAPAAPVK